jgi:hypothetical protein
MFNRFFCFLFLTAVGLNLFLFNVNIKSQAVELQKPYISEVYKSNLTMPNTCYDGKLLSTYPRGLCHIDIWIEIANPSDVLVSLQGYKLNFAGNYKKSLDGSCTSEKGVYCGPVELDSFSIQPKSQIVLKEQFGSFNSSLNGSPNTFGKFLIHPNNLINENSFNFNLTDVNGSMIETQNLYPMSNSVQFCLDASGNKSQSPSKVSTPGAKNDCPETKKVEAPIIPPSPPEPSKPAKEPEPILQSVKNTDPKLSENNKSTTNLISEIAKSEEKQIIQPSLAQKAAPQQAQISPILIPKIEIKTDIKPETKKITPVTFKVEQETIPVQIKIDKPVDLVKPANVETKKEVVDKVNQKPVLAENQQVSKPIVNVEKIVSKPIQTFTANINPSVISQTKVINIVDEKQVKIFGVDVTKAATVDMHTIKVNFIYFDLAIILFLLTKATLENKQYSLKLFDLARRKFFQFR